MEQQISVFRERLPDASIEERRQIAHAIAGAARNLGAFPLAAAASLLEAQPRDRVLAALLDGELTRTLDFIRTIGVVDVRRGAAG